MHELSLCKAIGSIVGRHAAGRQVTAVHLDVGALRQVVPDSLTFCWGLANAGTPWETSELDVRLVPARLTCLDCGESTELTEPFLVCGSCESRAVTIASGDELLVTSIDLVDA